jgi:hypothetical protein
VFFHLSSRHCHYVQLNDCEFLKYCRMMTLIRIVFLFLTLLFPKRWISQKYRITQSKFTLSYFILVNDCTFFTFITGEVIPTILLCRQNYLQMVELISVLLHFSKTQVGLMFSWKQHANVQTTKLLKMIYENLFQPLALSLLKLKS